VLEPDAEVEKCVERIVAAMPFRYLVNIDVAFRHSSRQGGVLPYDINPRLSAIVTATKAAGCFLLAEAMRDAVGMKSMPRRIQPTRMARYWNEHYSSEDRGKMGSVQRMQRKEPV
jgi:carbamoylphosphate synthase large subunit